MLLLCNKFCISRKNDFGENYLTPNTLSNCFYQSLDDKRATTRANTHIGALEDLERTRKK